MNPRELSGLSNDEIRRYLSSIALPSEEWKDSHPEPEEGAACDQCGHLDREGDECVGTACGRYVGSGRLCSTCRALHEAKCPACRLVEHPDFVDREE